MENAATDKYAEYGESRLDLIQDLDLVKEKKIVDLRVKPDIGVYEPYMEATVIYDKFYKGAKNFADIFASVTRVIGRRTLELFDQSALVRFKASE